VAGEGSKKPGAGGRRSSSAEVERLMAEKEAGDDKVFALSHRVATLEVRERDLSELIIGHRERVAALEAEREAFLRELDRSTSEAEAVRERESALAGELTEARERAAGLEAERAALTEKLDEEKRRSDRLSARDIERDGRLSAARDRIAELERNLELARAEVERADQRAAALSERRDELAGELEAHRGRIAALESELAEQRERTAEEQRRGAELTSELSGRAERVAALEAERVVLRDELDASRRETATLRDREREIQSRTVILHEQVARLEAEEEMLNRALAEERTTRSALEQQESGLRPQLESARERVRSLESQRAELQESTQRRERELQERIEIVEEEMARLQGQREGLERALAEQQENQAVLQQRETELAGARERITGLETKREQLVGELQAERQTLEQLRGREEELQRELTDLRDREAELESTLQGVRDQVSSLESQRNSLLTERDRLNAERDRLRSRLEQLESSRTYRMMRMTWRMRARLRHPFRRATPRPALTKPKKAASKPVRPAIAAPAPKPMPAAEGGRKLKPIPTPKMRPAAARTAEPKPEPESKPPPEKAAEAPAQPEPKPEAPPAAVEPEAAPAPAPVAGLEEDLERERWLAKAQAPPADVRQLRVAGVLDEMSAACFGPDCDLLRIDSENWAEAMEAHEPHLLLVESAWQGNNGSWQYMVASYTHPDYIGLPNLRSLIAWCRERDIPTVFWNKEDPVHFERFKEAAALFDYIFTSDANCIERYAALEREGAGPISSLQFAAQPRVHNPIGAPVERSTSPVFAGAYYRDRHIDRQRSLQMLLDAAMPFGLEIYDRRFGHEDKAFGFPERFTERVKGALPYDQIINAYKAHRIFLNVNSVHDSPTMFSRRVFELLACGTAVVSTESVGVQQTLGDVVSMVETPEQATEALTKLQDDDFWRELTAQGRRRVVGEHTYRHRLAEVANTLGFNVAPYPGEEIAALALVDDVEQARRFRAVVASVSAQETRPAELLIGSHTSVVGDLQELQSDGGEIRVRVVQQDPETTRSQRYRELAALAASPWLAIVHPAQTYGEHHLTDLVLSTRYVDADVIGNASFETTEGDGAIDRDLEHRFVDSVHPHSVLVRRDLIATRGWPDDAEGAPLSDWFREGVRIYSGDAGNFRADAAIGLPGRAAGSGP
jgi:spore maturation protein CgeB/predicted  nucleic acid-binding Zn-ribbon protein